MRNGWNGKYIAEPFIIFPILFFRGILNYVLGYLDSKIWDIDQSSGRLLQIELTFLGDVCVGPYILFILILRRLHKRLQRFPYKIPNLKITNTQNPDHSKSRHSQKPTKNIKPLNDYFKQSKYRAKYLSFKISGECHSKENFFAKNHTSRDRKCLFDTL